MMEIPQSPFYLIYYKITHSFFELCATGPWNKCTVYCVLSTRNTSRSEGNKLDQSKPLLKRLRRLIMFYIDFEVKTWKPKVSNLFLSYIRLM